MGEPVVHYSSRSAAEEVGGAPWAAAPHAAGDYSWDVQGYLLVRAVAESRAGSWGSGPL